MIEAASQEPCSRCGGVGQAVKRINRRRDGSISSVVYDLKAICKPCRGSGLACMEVRRDRA